MEVRPEETVSSETIYRGKLISVRRDVVLAAGGRRTEREIVEHPAAVAAVAIDGDGSLLLIRQHRKAVGRTLLEIPAGVVEAGESLEEAVRREMREETGLDPGRVDHLTSFYTSPGFSNEIVHVFRVTDLSGHGRPEEPMDAIQVERISLTDARRRLARGEIVDAKTVVGIMLESASLHNE